MTQDTAVATAEAPADAPDLPKGSTKTRPWTQDEYLYVNDVPLVYTVSKLSGITVRMPGGTSATPETLRDRGFEVRMPETVRLTSV